WRTQEQGGAPVRSRGRGCERCSGAKFSQQMKSHGGDERWKARRFSMAPTGLMVETGDAVERRETERASGAMEVVVASTKGGGVEARSWVWCWSRKDVE
ncbi:hypothetical protein PIB30_089271, partial [Stylosanthes scabra]|nr:hypothetical protein [Stylosanthes scabra]